MSSLLNYIGFFFALMLSFTSISKDYDEVVLHIAVQEKTNAPVSSHVLAKKQNDIYCIQQQSVHVASSGNSYPAPDSKINSYNLLKGTLSLEQSIGSHAATYLSYSRKIFPGYSATTIIFPFHYFW